MNTQFIGEHLGPGQLGHFFVILSFIGALFSAFCYYRSVATESLDAANSRSWQRLARNTFIIHTAAIIGIFITLYYIIANHLFEYHYAWEHSSRELPTRYLFSCFWEGQEGSFMLWTFWHSVLGLIVMNTAKGLETRAMTVIAIVQVFLASMLLGIYLGPEVRIGSYPFMLLRHSMAGAPIFAQANYMEFIKDGNGLNVLLQNYWMVIHPPVLFLGFASTLIPFAYCIAALWKGEYQSFVKPTLVWSLFGGAVLGTGIMMGGAWAYESLSFGGYWAWDPVENASLVPWLTLVGGLHTLVVYKSTKRSLPITFILLLLTQLLVWYSTFLTRTGVLSKTSVHAFTGDGKFLYWHLIVVLGLLLALAVGMLIRRWKSMPKVVSEEAVSSREFWMFIGSFVLLLSAIQIMITTSIPVWAPLAKWITGKEVAPPLDPVKHYNSIQVWVAIVIGFLSATILFLRFKKSDSKAVWRNLGITAAIAAVMSLIVGYTQEIKAWQYALLLFASCYAIVANIYYTFVMQKGQIKKLGPSVAHLGFGMILLGILLSSYNKQVLSLNTLGEVIDFGKNTAAENAKESRENVVLMRDIPVAMGDYFATYRGDSTSTDDPRVFYRVDYMRRDPKTKEVKEAFVLYPDVFMNRKEQNFSANPASKHYLDRDIFTYVTRAADPKEKTDTNSFKSYTVHKGDTIYIDNGYLVFNGFNPQVNDPRYQAQPGDIAVAAQMSVYTLKGLVQNVAPIYYIRNQFENQIDDTVKSMGMYTRFAKVIPDQNAAEIMVKQTNPKDDYIVLKALVFPYINVLWLGVLVMVIGFFLSLWNRSGQAGLRTDISGM